MSEVGPTPGQRAVPPLTLTASGGPVVRKPVFVGWVPDDPKTDDNKYPHGWETGGEVRLEAMIKQFLVLGYQYGKLSGEVEQRDGTIETASTQEHAGMIGIGGSGPLGENGIFQAHFSGGLRLGLQSTSYGGSDPKSAFLFGPELTFGIFSQIGKLQLGAQNTFAYTSGLSQGASPISSFSLLTPKVTAGITF